MTGSFSATIQLVRKIVMPTHNWTCLRPDDCGQRRRRRPLYKRTTECSLTSRGRAKQRHLSRNKKTLCVGFLDYRPQSSFYSFGYNTSSKWIHSICLYKWSFLSTPTSHWKLTLTIQGHLFISQVGKHASLSWRVVCKLN